MPLLLTIYLQVQNHFHTTNWRLCITSKVQRTGYFTAASIPLTVNTLRQHACIFVIANTHRKSHLQLSLKHNVIHPQNDYIPVQCSFVTISMSTLQLPWSSEKNLTSIICACCCFRKMVHLKSRAVTLIIGKLQSPWRPYEISWASPPPQVLILSNTPTPIDLQKESDNTAIPIPIINPPHDNQWIITYLLYSLCSGRISHQVYKPSL
jgi:hypothetical protein